MKLSTHTGMTSHLQKMWILDLSQIEASQVENILNKKNPVFFSASKDLGSLNSKRERGLVCSLEHHLIRISLTEKTSIFESFSPFQKKKP